MSHYYRFTILCIFLVAAQLLSASVFSSNSKDFSKEDLCPYLTTLHRVSYEGQEPKLFKRMMERVEESPVSSPSAEKVLLVFEACLNRYRDRIGEDEESSNSCLASEAAVELVAPIRFKTSSDGTAFEVGYGESKERSYKAGGNLAVLAGKVTKQLTGQVASDDRATLANQLWFLWIESYLRAIGERHNSYDYACELIVERAEDRGRSFSVGFEVEVEEDRFVVTEVHDEHLREAGLAFGDEVISLNARFMSEMTVPELQNFWLNQESFSFTVVGRREGQSFEVSGVAVPRRIKTLSWSFHGDTGYVRIRKFAKGSLIEMRRALRALESEQVNRLILDVRGNRGGVVSTGLVDIFFKPGQTVLSYHDLADEEAVDIDATVEYQKMPTAILVDHASASMAETLVAAFQTHERGPIVGEGTRGKGVGQSLLDVLDEGRLHLVDRTYYYPGTRDTWNNIGITPTSEIELDDEAEELLQPYLDSHIIRLDEQWELDAVLRQADRMLKEEP